MSEEGEINTLVEACVKTHELVKAYGTPEMQATMRMLLFQIGQEVARRQAESQKKRDGE